MIAYVSWINLHERKLKDVFSHSVFINTKLVYAFWSVDCPVMKEQISTNTKYDF